EDPPPARETPRRLAFHRLGEGHDREDPEARQNGIVGRVVADGEKVRLQDPGAGRENAGPASPAPGDEEEDRSGGDAEDEDRPEPGARQFRPVRGQVIADETDQGIKWRMTVRLLTREWPEPGEDLGVEEELAIGVDLVLPRRDRADLLHQLD